MDLQIDFEEAVKFIQTMPKEGPYQPNNELKLKFYGLFKIATEGPCKNPKPGFFDLVGKAKWEAWTALGEMSADEAMRLYVEEFRLVKSKVEKQYT